MLELRITISEKSPEGQVVESIASREHISPEDVLRRALKQFAESPRTPGERMLGAFSSDEDSRLLDEAIRRVDELRQSDQLKRIDLA